MGNVDYKRANVEAALAIVNNYCNSVREAFFKLEETMKQEFITSELIMEESEYKDEQAVSLTGITGKVYDAEGGIDSIIKSFVDGCTEIANALDSTLKVNIDNTADARAAYNQKAQAELEG